MAPFSYLCLGRPAGLPRIPYPPPQGGVSFFAGEKCARPGIYICGMSTAGFSVNVGELKDKVERFKYVIPNRPERKIFGHILLNQVERTLVISGCDDMKYAYSVLGVEQISWEGTRVKMAVPYKQLMDFLKGISDENILKCAQIQGENAEPCLLVESSGERRVFQGIDASNFPPFPKLPNSAEIILAIEDVIKVFTEKANKSDLFSPSGYELLLGGEQDCLLPETKNIVVPEESLRAFLLSVEGLCSDYPASIYLSEARIGFGYAGFGLESALLNGTYFAHQGAISTETPYAIIFERGQLCDAIRSLVDLANKETQPIEFVLADDRATLLAQNKGHGSTRFEHVPCQYSGNTFKIRLNGKNILSILEEIHGWHIIMKVIRMGHPVIIEPERQVLSRKVVGLIMPFAESG